MIEFGTPEHLDQICEIAIQLNKSLRCAEEGKSGLLMRDFVNHFELYSKCHKITTDEFIVNSFSILIKAYERKDVLFVADILHYEFMPYVKNIMSAKLSN